MPSEQELPLQPDVVLLFSVSVWLCCLAAALGLTRAFLIEYFQLLALLGDFFGMVRKHLCLEVSPAGNPGLRQHEASLHLQ